MKLPRRTLALLAVITPLLVLFVYVALRSGPLAPVAVIVDRAQMRSLHPALFGIGTVQARYTYRIGPTAAGRIRQLDVEVGDAVSAGQLLGEMDAVDLDERIRAQQAAIDSALANTRQAEVRLAFAHTQAQRYERLLRIQGTSEENTVTKRQELALATAAQAAARADVARLRAELQALNAQRSNLRLVAPVAGLVSARHADPGTTMVAGQAVIDVIDPASLWVDARFDQISAAGLDAGLPADIVLRSRSGERTPGRVVRVEPQADVVTEETLAKVVFTTPLLPRPPVGELAEITVQLPALPPAPTIPNAAIRSVDGKRGVWALRAGELAFAPLRLGRADLDGQVQVLQGLAADEQFVVYSEKALTARSRVHVVDRLPGVSP